MTAVRRIYRSVPAKSTLDGNGRTRLERQMTAAPKRPLDPAKAEAAATARAARKAASEAAALRANLHRRKQQDRARTTAAETKTCR